MTHLFALCRKTEEVEIKRVKITRGVQKKIGGVFQAQAATFLEGVTEEISFDGDWKPETNEVFVMDHPSEITLVNQSIDKIIALPTVDATNFIEEGIKSLFTVAGDGASRRIFFQVFSPQQLLSHKIFPLMLDKNTFRELTEPAFTLDSSLAAIVEEGKLKFKSFHKAKRIFDLLEFYQEATDQQIEAFCLHENLSVPDVEKFKKAADQQVRRLVYALSKADVLNKHGVNVIATKATMLGLSIQINDGKIVVPTDRKNLKQLLRFLDDAVYEAPLTSQRYITNSKRPFV